MKETDAGSTSQTGRGRGWLYAALALLFLLRYDLWLWNDTRLVLGLPIGLLYHVLFCLVAAVLLAALVKWAWPSFDVPDEDSDS